MKIITLFILIKICNGIKYHIIENVLKCTNNDQLVILKNSEISTTEFSITLWVRMTHYHDTEKPFLKFFNFKNNGEINLTSKKDPNNLNYEIYYLTNFLGSLYYSNTPLNTFEEQDFQNMQGFYEGWHYLVISFFKNPNKIYFFVNYQISSQFNILENHEIEDLVLYPCLSIDINNLGGLYFTEFAVVNMKCNDFQQCDFIRNNYKFTALYLFTENTKKNNKYLIHNQLNNEFGPLEVVTDRPEYPFRQNRNNYTISNFRKLFRFKVDNIYIRDSSYIIACKVHIENIKGSGFKFIIYGRANKDLNILNNDPDVVNITMNFTNDDSNLYGYVEYNIPIIASGQTANIFNGNFTGNLYFTVMVKIKYQKHYQQGTLSELIYASYENGNHKQENSMNVDLSDINFDDQHFFGNPTTLIDDLAFFNILEYIIYRGYWYNMSESTEIGDYRISHSIFNQKRFNEFDTEDVLYDSSGEALSGYCGNNCEKCDPNTNKCFSCFNRFIMNNDFTCFNNCSGNDFYDEYLQRCFSLSELTLIDITYDVNGLISNNSLTAIQEAFDQILLQNFNLLIIIKLKVILQNLNFYTSEITFFTSIDTYLNRNSFDTYFNEISSNNYSFQWKFYYKIINNPSDYNNIKFYGKCLTNEEYFRNTSNGQGLCVTDCGTGYYNDLNNFCQKCSPHCNSCNKEVCLICEENFLLFYGFCMTNLKLCNVIDLNCVSCTNPNLCEVCKIGYFLNNGICLSNLNCKIIDSNCNSCDILNESICSNCLQNYNFDENFICTLNLISCLISVENCELCNFLNDTICEKCLDGFYYDIYFKKCLKIICQDNCLECHLDTFDNKICTICKNVFSLYENNCLKSICFSSFCNNCSFNLIEGCDICYECLNLDFINGLILNCEEIFQNCEFCFFKLNSELNCLKCNNKSIFEKDKNICSISTRVKEKTSFLNFLGDDFYKKECKNNYFYDKEENECYRISNDCNYGCINCWEENKYCFECDKNFILKHDTCYFNQIKTEINEDSDNFEEILKYFHFEDNICINNINNITLKIQNNITKYLDELHFIHEKTFEIKEFYIDCSKNIEKCKEYNKKKNIIALSDFNSCNKIMNRKNVFIIYNNTNVTTNNNVNYCRERENKLNFKENIICENLECSDYHIYKEYRNLTNLKECKKFYGEISNEQKIKKIKYLKKEKYEFCQKQKIYFFTWKKECKKQCVLEIKSEKENTFLVNTNKNSKIIISIKNLQKDLPNYINAKFDYENQKLYFVFLKNIPYINISINPLHIKLSKGCVVTKRHKFKIKNNHYLSNIEFQNYLRPSESGVSALIVASVNLTSFSIVPSSFYEIFQFIELFSFFGYLEIDGGYFYNFIFSLQKNENDLDIFLIDNKKHYEYLIKRSLLKNLLTVSLFDIYLLFGIFFIHCFQIILKNTRIWRYNLMRKLYKKIQKKQKNYLKMNIFAKIYQKFLLYYLIYFDSFEILKYLKEIIFTQYIFRLPQYIILFVKKYHLIDKKYFIIYYLMFLTINLFLLQKFISRINFFKSNTNFLYTDIMVVNNKKYNWYFVYYNFVYLSINLINVFIISFFKDFPRISFIFVIILILIETVLVLYYSKRKYIYFNIFNILTTISFLIWIIFVGLKKIFKIELNFILSISYIASNLFKFISSIVLIFTLRKKQT